MLREQVGAFLATSLRRSPSGQVVHAFVCERDGFDDARDTPSGPAGRLPKARRPTDDPAPIRQ